MSQATEAGAASRLAWIATFEDMETPFSVALALVQTLLVQRSAM